MSDDLTRELARSLRESAESAERPPPLPAAGIRRLAVRRRRRRRTTAAVAGVCAAGVLAVVLTAKLAGGGAEDHSAPAAGPVGTPSAPVTAADATVDLGRRVLVIDDRELPVSSGSVDTPTPTGRMTVTRKTVAREASAEGADFAGPYTVKVSWVIELSAPDGDTTFIGAMTHDEKAPGN